MGTLEHCWREHEMVQPWKREWRFLKELKTELPYDPAIPPLGIYPKELKTVSERDICTLTFTVAPFTIVKCGSNPSDHQSMNG